MCGIGGMVQWAERPAFPADLARMLQAMAHRGPDDEGRYLDGPVALGHRRLSIIDLATGKQPLTNEDGSLVLVMNGEIYNYRQLRAETLARGHRYRTQSDAEVILHLYEDEGVECLRRFNGMFAFALWDGARQRLWLARDRAGKKPLYYAQTPEAFVFASELKGLLAHPAVEREVDPQGLGSYLVHGFVPAPGTVLRGAHKLPPASYALIERGEVRVTRYWRLPEAGEPRPVDDRAVTAEFRQRLTEAVTRRLVADVPVGVLLSGGLDSSTIVAALAQAGVSPIRTFSLGIGEPSFDERPYAELVARRFGTQHQSWAVSFRECVDLIPRLGRLIDEPIVDASIVPTYLLARLTRSQVKVALGGDGGDELLGGYPTYLAHQLALQYRRWPRWVRRHAVAPAIQRLPVSFRYLSTEFRLKRFVAGAEEPTAALRHARWMDVVPPAQLGSLLHPDRARALDLASLDSPYPMHWNGGDVVTGAMRCDFHLYLQELVLTKVDRASMAVGLEVRAPFLDVELIEWLTALPRSWKVRGGRGKHLLRRAFGPVLPPTILRRGKQGFALPVGQWFHGPLRSLVGDLLHHDRVRRAGLWNASSVRELLDAHWARRADYGRALWALVVFELWRDQVLEPSLVDQRECLGGPSCT